MRPIKTLQLVVAITFVLAVSLPAQAPPPPPNAPLLSPDQLDTLVAPIALYPDNLLSQILAASTYPLEIVELSQWLQQNRGLTGEALMNGARAQGWDPSVAALAAFPDVVTNLNRDIRWTTDLGNAFLAQQAAVMDAVQRMRARAQSNGKLNSNSQVTVETQTQNGQSAIVIVPANPQVVYVPEYDPAWVWGPPGIGYYPPAWYPGVGFGFGFGPGIYIGAFFGGCCGWGGWGWGWQPRWWDHQIYVNNYFFHRYGFGGYYGGGFRGAGVWEHDPGHRFGVPYPNRELSNRFRGGGAGFNRGFAANQRAFSAREPAFNRGGDFGRTIERAPTERFGSPGFERANPGGSHSVFGGARGGGFARIQSDRGFSSMRGGFGGFHGGGGFGGARGGGGFHGGGGRR
ncbi:MAG TPA: DUF3300 domain-containing protein [Bryobacteraceae bacterium]|nr:DUF3300 domain-containing protein [Bryobacteraceae bacterium]